MGISTLVDEGIKLSQNVGQIEATSYPSRTESSAMPLENLKTRIPEVHFGHCTLSNERMMRNEMEISEQSLSLLTL
jgi:hypothetical protein